MRYLFFIIILIMVLGGARLGFCDWEEMIQVNTNNSDKQASRDSDCPWPIAADDSGNVYTVWEDNQTDDLEVYFRKRNYDGTWDSQEKISNEETILVPNYGHPSICVIKGPYPTKLLTCYVREHDGSLPRELRGNTFNGEQWGDPSYYISDDNSDPNYELPNSSSGWGTNIVALSDGKAYAFWQYDCGSNYTKLYFNEYDDGWDENFEKIVYDDSEASEHYSAHENAYVDGDDNIHLVYSDDETGQNEIYYLFKKPQDDDFGEFPGYHVSTTPNNVDSKYPYCAVSYVADTTFLHVVWSTEVAAFIYYRNWNSVTETWSGIIDTIAPQVVLRNAEKPSVACDSYGNVHVVWEQELEDGSFDLVKYRKFDYAAGEWGTIVTLPADEEEIDAYAVPVIISDVYDNLHVLMTGRRVGVEAADEEVYYSFYDSPPHIEDLEFLANESDEDSVVIAWTGWDEPDLDTYEIYRKYLGQSWEYVNSTADTRYSDTESSYSPGGFTQIDYYVVAVDDAEQETCSDTIIVFGSEQHKMLTDGYAIARFELKDNYPNPFNAQTTIEYNLPAESYVTLNIFDVLGRKIETIVEENQPPGPHAVTWDSNKVSSGMYFYRLKAGEFAATKRMSIIK